MAAGALGKLVSSYARLALFRTADTSLVVDRIFVIIRNCVGSQRVLVCAAL